MKKEIWMPISGYEGLYKISSKGRVYGVKHDRFRKLNKNRLGYFYVDLWKNGKQHAFTVHKLVALAFIGKPPTNAHVVNHIDGNKQNNNIENLEYITQRENVIHAFRLGLATPPIPVTKKVLCIDEGIVFETVTEAANWSNGSTGNISRACKKMGYSAGHSWCYLEDWKWKLPEKLTI